MAAMDDNTLKAITDEEIRNSVGGTQGGKLSAARRKAEYYYLGLPKGDLAPPEVDGRSTFVDTTVRNQIEWMMPSLMKTFCSGESVVQFTASKEGDEDKAELATDYINHLFYKKNLGYTILQTAMRDALLQKAGIIKIWWDSRKEESREEYRGMADVDLALLMEDDEVTPIEQSSYPDEDDAKQRQEAIAQLSQQLQQAMQIAQTGDPEAVQGVEQLSQQIQEIQSQPPKMLYDVSFKRSKTAGKLCIEAVPPDEFIISRKSKNMSDGFMKGHHVLRTISDLKAFGYKNVDEITSDDNEGMYASERLERMGWDDDGIMLDDGASGDPSLRMVWLTEMYMQVDYNGDGIAEWRKIVRAGDQILENEECDGAPFAALIPIIMPHRFFGLSVADLAMEPQKLQTQLIRSILDNQFLQVNGRYWAVSGQVNLDELLTSRPGGVVRMSAPNMAGRLDQGQGDTAGAMKMVEWSQDFAENSTGWTRRSQGTGPSGLQQQTATGMNLITNRDDMRLDLIARNFAEGGITDLFRMMMKLVCQYQNKEDMISVSGNWAQIDPREWKNQFGLTVNVGLGTNNKEQQAQHLMGLMQIQQQALAINVATPENVYNAAKLYAEALGQKTGDKFFTNPKDAPQKEPPPDPALMKVQADQQINQAKLQADVQKYQAEQIAREKELALEDQKETHRIELEAQKQMQQAQFDMQERQHKAELDAQLESQRVEFDSWKAQLESNTKIAVAQISAGANQQEDGSFKTDGEVANNLQQDAITSALEGFAQAIQNLARPKVIIRDENGRAQGIQ